MTRHAWPIPTRLLPTTLDEARPLLLAAGVPDGLLRHGAHGTDHKACCAIEARNLARGADWGDTTSAEDHDTLGAWARTLNDRWPVSDDEGRTATLGWAALCAPPDAGWKRRVCDRYIRELLPPVLRAVGRVIPLHQDDLERAAEACENCEPGGEQEAARAAASAARQARTNADAYAADAAAAAYAAAARLEILTLAARIGRECLVAPAASVPA